MNYLEILMFIYLLAALVAMGALTNSGSWQRISDGRILEYHSPWTLTLGGTMLAVFFIGGGLFPIFIHSNVNPAGPILLLVWLIMAAGTGLMMLWLSSPHKLIIDLQEKTYCQNFRLQLWRKPYPRPLADFLGVCPIPRGTLMLVFRKKQGLFYGLVLGIFVNNSHAREKAREFSNLTGLPIVTYPWNKRSQGFSS